MKIERHVQFASDVELSVPDDNALRVFSKGFTKSEVFELLTAYAEIEESGIPVPGINKVFRVRDGRWGVLEDNIRGKTLFQELNEQPDNYQEILEIMTEQQLLIHSKTIRGLPSMNEELIYQINSLTDVAPAKKDKLIKIVRDAPESNRLLHGRFGPDAVVSTENDKLFILNWDYAAYGNIEADAAMTYLRLAIGSTVAAEAYLKIFTEKSNADAEYIREWIPVLAASQLAESKVSILHKKILYAWLGMVSEIDEIL